MADSVLRVQAAQCLPWREGGTHERQRSCCPSAAGRVQLLQKGGGRQVAKSLASKKASPGIGPMIVAMAKEKKEKGRGKKGARQAKLEEVAAPPPAPAPKVGPPYEDGDIILHSLSVIDSYFRATGKPIFPPEANVEIASAAKSLFEAPFVLVSHGTEEDPIFNYGNANALKVFEADWEALMRTPSRAVAPEEQLAARAALLDGAGQGVVELKGLVQQSLKGRMILLKEGISWTLKNLEGETFGQAVLCRDWAYADEEEEEEKAAPASNAADGGDGSASAAPQDGSSPGPDPLTVKSDFAKAPLDAVEAAAEPHDPMRVA